MIEIIIIISLTLIIILLIFLVIKSKEKRQEEQSFVMMQGQIQEIQRILNDRLGETTQVLQYQSTQRAKDIQELTEKLVRLDETNKQFINYAEQIEKLQHMFKNPKQRGFVGEYYLETLLKNSLPPNSYKMQYKFPNSAIVDAVVFFGDKVIPIDAKFSLDNYNRLIEEKDLNQREKMEKIFINDLKNRIDETAKYIMPEQGTTDVAFMFIPAEAIFYDLLVNQVGAVKGNTRDFIDYAYKKKVVIVSPTTFAAYLQVLFQALRAFQVQESTKEILTQIEKLSRHLINHEDFLKKLGVHLQTTLNIYQNTCDEFNKINKDIVKITEREMKQNKKNNVNSIYFFNLLLSFFISFINF
jgi:DNA recombination protein RmuC